jgi:O-antigen ligase
MPTLVKESAVFALLFRVASAAKRSLAGYILGSIMAWFGKMSRASLFAYLLGSEEKMEKKWSESFFCRFISFFANLIPSLLKKIYLRWQKLFDGSFFISLVQLAGWFGPVFVALTLFALLSVPFKAWNNLYGLVLAFASLLLVWLRNVRGEGTLEVGSIGMWPIAFAFVSLASAAWSQHFDLSLRFVFFALACVLIVWSCAAGIRDEKRLLALLLVCAAGIIICGVYGFYQRFVEGIEASSSYTDLSVNANMPGRVYSFFDNPNACASVMVFFCPLMLTMTIYAKGFRAKLVFAAAFLLGTGTLLLTFSRGAWVAFAVAVAVVVLIAKPRLIPVFVVLAFVALPLVPKNVVARFLTIFGGEDSSINSRTYIYTAMYKLIRANPIAGVGLGTTNLKEVMDNSGFYKATFPFVHAHSVYFEVWAESGIIAFVSFVLAMLCGIKKGVKTAKNASGSRVSAGAALGAVGGLSGALVFSLTDYTMSYPRVLMLFWFLFAIIYAAAGVMKKDPAR